ncbi:helix-turn-helix domain-containing protein [Nocardiopsis sp. NPDC006938]|uniref:helix-turn-helix domain-containing protein n=1 Tax=Nocardiopsis sp. NPDC006938 TaxID=3364337 RepID=UPI0036AB886C
MLTAVRERDAQRVIQFLRRRVKNLSQEALAGMCGVAQSTINRAEAGKGLTDRRRAVEALQGLGAPLENEDRVMPLTGFPTAQVVPSGDIQVKLADVERRRFLRTVGTGVATAPLLSLTGLPNTSSAVTVADITQVHQAATMFSNWDHSYGGSGVRAVVSAQLKWAVELLERNIPAQHHAEVFSAVARLAMVSGFMAFDAYAHTHARTMFTFAAQAAEEAGNWQLRAKVLSHRARQEIWCRNPEEGLTFAELGLVRADRLSEVEQAMLHTARARAFAKLQDKQATLAAIGAADEAFNRTERVPPPAWMTYYDQAQHHGDTGHALWDLAVEGLRAPKDAEWRLAAAVHGHPDAYRRSRAISGIKLASLRLRFGDHEQAQSTAVTALSDMGQVHSKRALDDLKELSVTAARHQASELSEHTATVIESQP